MQICPTINFKTQASLHVPYYRDEKIIKDFGKTIKKYRLLIGISQEELADRSELDLTQIGRIQRGITNTSISIANKLAKALNVSIKELFENE